ncbi:MAG: hypothetical protein LYZ69_06485 [Nitrososphaerales archaeon]|nr:hypothetical protein [Nitrososphaerales archaeon]
MFRLDLEKGTLPSKYDSCRLSNIHDSVLELLGVGGTRRLPSDVFDGVDTDGVEKIVLFVFDGFGRAIYYAALGSSCGAPVGG